MAAQRTNPPAGATRHVFAPERDANVEWRLKQVNVIRFRPVPVTRQQLVFNVEINQCPNRGGTPKLIEPVDKLARIEAVG